MNPLIHRCHWRRSGKLRVVRVGPFVLGVSDDYDESAPWGLYWCQQWRPWLYRGGPLKRLA